jgi:hypothetical protein
LGESYGRTPQQRHGQQKSTSGTGEVVHLEKTSKESNDLRVGDRVLFSLNPDAQSMMTGLAALVARLICVLTT